MAIDGDTAFAFGPVILPVAHGGEVRYQAIALTLMVLDVPEPDSKGHVPTVSASEHKVGCASWSLIQTDHEIQLAISPAPVKDPENEWDFSEVGASAIVRAPLTMPVGEFFARLRASGSGPVVRALLGEPAEP